MKDSLSSQHGKLDECFRQVTSIGWAPEFVVDDLYPAPVSQDAEDRAREVLASSPKEPCCAGHGKPGIRFQHRVLSHQLRPPICRDRRRLGVLGIRRSAISGEDHVGADGDQVGSDVLRGIGDVASGSRVGALASLRFPFNAIDVGAGSGMDDDIWLY
jgi:hypothetical protein